MQAFYVITTVKHASSTINSEMRIEADTKEAACEKAMQFTKTEYSNIFKKEAIDVAIKSVKLMN